MFVSGTERICVLALALLFCGLDIGDPVVNDNATVEV